MSKVRQRHFFILHVKLRLTNVPKVGAKVRRRPSLGWLSPSRPGLAFSRVSAGLHTHLSMSMFLAL